MIEFFKAQMNFHLQNMVIDAKPLKNNINPDIKTARSWHGRSNHVQGVHCPVLYILYNVHVIHENHYHV